MLPQARAMLAMELRNFEHSCSDSNTMPINSSSRKTTSANNDADDGRQYPATPKKSNLAREIRDLQRTLDTKSATRADLQRLLDIQSAKTANERKWNNGDSSSSSSKRRQPLHRLVEGDQQQQQQQQYHQQQPRQREYHNIDDLEHYYPTDASF